MRKKNRNKNNFDNKRRWVLIANKILWSFDDAEKNMSQKLHQQGFGYSLMCIQYHTFSVLQITAYAWWWETRHYSHRNVLITIVAGNSYFFLFVEIIKKEYYIFSLLTLTRGEKKAVILKGILAGIILVRYIFSRNISRYIRAFI